MYIQVRRISMIAEISRRFLLVIIQQRSLTHSYIYLFGCHALLVPSRRKKNGVFHQNELYRKGKKKKEVYGFFDYIKKFHLK